jgi:hypothetical protein
LVLPQRNPNQSLRLRFQKNGRKRLPVCRSLRISPKLMTSKFMNKRNKKCFNLCPALANKNKIRDSPLTNKLLSLSSKPLNLSQDQSMKLQLENAEMR